MNLKVPNPSRATKVSQFRRIAIATLAVVVATATLTVFTHAASAANGYNVFQGPKADVGDRPTQEKPESKLWYTEDNIWWSWMWNESRRSYDIARLDSSGNGSWAFQNIGDLETRKEGRADAVYYASDNKLFVASHLVNTNPTMGSNSYLYELTYKKDTQSWERVGRTVFNNWQSETLTIDRDKNGDVWGSWVGGGKVHVAHAKRLNGTMQNATQHTINNPLAENIYTDDISTLVALDGGNKIGVMWSSQWDDNIRPVGNDRLLFGVASITSQISDAKSWTVSNAISEGIGASDDHLNIKLNADGGAQLYAVYKTGNDDDWQSDTYNTSPGLVLLKGTLSGNDVDWSTTMVTSVKECATRPQLVLDPTADRIHVYYSANYDCDANPKGGWNGLDGAIYEKIFSMSSPQDSNTKGSIIMEDPNATYTGGNKQTKPEDPTTGLNDPTTTKQTVSSATGVVVLSSSSVDQRYWTAFKKGSGAGVPTTSTTSTPPSSTTSTTPGTPSEQPMKNVVAMAPVKGGGYLLAQADGAVRGFGNAKKLTRNTPIDLNVPIVGIAPTRTGNGYWLVASDGGIFNYGDAGFYGSMGGKPLNKPMVGIAPYKNGEGYWTVAADGGIFSFGDTEFYGSMGGQPLNKPVVSMTPTLSGSGYLLVATDGGIFAFGDAKFYGSMGGLPLNKPMNGIAISGKGEGYWTVASDGGIFAFGDAPFRGSMGGQPLNKPIIGMAPTASGEGYWLSASDGGIFNYGDAAFLGSGA